MAVYSRKDLPVNGVMWHYFATQNAAEKFAQWAEKITVADEYPCEAFITREDDRPDGRNFVVKVRNW